VPIAESIQFTRSQIASRTINWMIDFYEYCVGLYVYINPLFGAPTQFLYATVQTYMPDVTKLFDWDDAHKLDCAFEDYECLEAHLTLVREQVLAYQEALYCALDIDGCLIDGSVTIFKNLTASTDTDIDKMNDFFDMFDHKGFAQFVTNGLVAYCDRDIDLTATDCDNWYAAMNFQVDDWSNSVDLLTGSYGSTNGYYAAEGGVLRIEINAHVLHVAFEICTNVADGAAAEIRVQNLDTSVFTSITPLINCKTYELAIYSTSGIAIEVTATSGTGDEVYLHHAAVQVIGTEPTP